MNPQDVYTRRFPGSIGIGMFLITPTDAANGGQLGGGTMPFALYVAASGNVSFIGMDGVEVDNVPVVAGSTIPVAINQVKASGTTATVYGIKL